MEALMRMEPHGRDYYPQGDAAYPTARREHLSRIRRLSDLYEELAAIAHRVAETVANSNRGAA